MSHDTTIQVTLSTTENSYGLDMLPGSYGVVVEVLVMGVFCHTFWVGHWIIMIIELDWMFFKRCAADCT